MQRCLRTMAIVAAMLAGPAAAETLFDQLGQEAGIQRIATQAVAVWRADPRVRADFEEIEPTRLVRRLSDQICQIAGGPCIYRGQGMAESHAGLKIDRARFNAVVEGLQQAMREEGVSFWTGNRLLALLAPMQRDIVTR